MDKPQNHLTWDRSPVPGHVGSPVQAPLTPGSEGQVVGLLQSGRDSGEDRGTHPGQPGQGDTRMHSQPQAAPGILPSARPQVRPIRVTASDPKRSQHRSWVTLGPVTHHLVVAQKQTTQLCAGHSTYY